MKLLNNCGIKTLIQLITILVYWPAHSQIKYDNDFSTWGWLQLEKEISKNQIVGFQYQIRFNQNSSAYDRTNLYFTYEYDFTKNWSSVVLYQLNVNYQNDQHTFYIDNTYKFRLHQHLSLLTRTALQYTSNYFSGDFILDKPLIEWRNRLRLVYKFSKILNSTISIEPYLAFDKIHQPYLSRIRYVGQVNFRYNKYQDFSVFYMYQPDVVSYGNLSKSYVLGFTDAIKLPNKLKKIGKIYKPSFIKDLINDEPHDNEMKDIFN